MMMTAIALPLDEPALNDAIGLQTTAEYISTLAEVVRDEMTDLRRLVGDGQPGLEKLNEWGTVEVLLNLIANQARVVDKTTHGLEHAVSKARRA